MNKRQASRLLNVALALRESPTPEAFCMDTYVHDEHSSFMLDSVPEDVNFCGAPACNLGHYGARRDLQRVIRIGREGPYGINPDSMALFYGNNKRVEFYDQKLLNHFGIDEDQAEDLFGPDGCNGAETTFDAADYIEDFVRKNYTRIAR